MDINGHICRINQAFMWIDLEISQMYAIKGVQIRMFSRDLLGKRIRKARGKKSQDVFAAELSISRGALSFYENGERLPDAEIIYKICECCNVSAGYLLGFTDNATTDTDLQAVCDYTGLSEEAVSELNLAFDSTNQPEAMNLEENEYVTELIKTLSWLISEQHIHEIIYHFLLVKYYSQKYVLLYEDMCTNGFFEINHKNEKSQGIKRTIDMKLTDLFKLQEIGEDIDKELDNISKLQEIEKDIDFERYRLNKYTEKLLNYFDQREQAQDNGKHNPPKE